MPRAARKRIIFRDDKTIAKLPIPKSGQTSWWDAGTRGLSVLVSCGGAKSFRSQFKLNGTWKTRTIGRFGDLVINDDGNEETISVEWARLQAKRDRLNGSRNIDPRLRVVTAPSLTFGQAVDRYIEQRAKVRQRTWRHTERILQDTCREWLDLPIVSITTQQTRDMLERFRQEGHSRKAKLTLSWLKALWRFCYEEEIVAEPIMDRVKFEHVKEIRDRVFDDKEIVAIWRATEKLSDQERDFIQLLLLLAPRKHALAGMRRDELNADLSLWTTPFERVKARKTANKRNYLTPLPRLASEIFQGRLTAIRFDVLFPGASPTKAFFPGVSLQHRVQKLSGVRDWAYHAHRHTMASWFRVKGHSLNDIGLLLNHSERGVTAGYSHGYPIELKRSLLQTWSDHVEGLGLR